MYVIEAAVQGVISSDRKAGDGSVASVEALSSGSLLSATRTACSAEPVCRRLL